MGSIVSRPKLRPTDQFFSSVYVEADRNSCNDLNFQFGANGIFAAIPNRAFSIKVILLVTIFHDAMRNLM